MSDLEIWPLIKKRPHSSLWLRSDLHAKYYRFDEQCLVGSANLTAKALGWSSSPNLELLLPLPASNPYLQDFEAELLKGCLPVDESLYQQMLKTVQLLKSESITSTILTVEEVSNEVRGEDFGSWLPTLRNPEELYLAYSGQWQRLTTAARETATQDLKYLSVWPHLRPKAFQAYVGALLLQHPLIRQVDALVETPQRFGAVRDLLATLAGRTYAEFNANRAWQTLMRWLLYFLPERYALSVPNHSEIFYRLPSQE